MRYLHTMVRVANLDASLDFYVNKMGMKEVRRAENEKGRYTLVFLAAFVFAPKHGILAAKRLVRLSSP